MIASYAGMVIGAALFLLLVRYVTAFRFIMFLIFLAGMLVSAAGGCLLEWPLLAYLSLTDSGWIWSGPLAGCLLWVIAVVRGWSGTVHSSRALP